MTTSIENNDTSSSGGVLDSVATKAQLSFAELMPRIVKERKISLSTQLREVIYYCMSCNKLSVDEYYQMLLFDPDYTTEEKKRFVGLGKSRKIWSKLMSTNTFLGLMDDKLTYEKMMQGFGIAVPETLAIVGGHYPAAPSLESLETIEDITAFFAAAQLPIFGKPVDAVQSLGAACFISFDAETNSLTLATGSSISVYDLHTEIIENFKGSYLFQKYIAPHRTMRRICQGGLPTVRIVTLNSGDGPEVYRAVVKLTSKGNAADNFWRSGNLLSPVDLEQGTMGKALTQMGIDGEFLSNHPVTGEQIEGVQVPHWDQLLEVSLTAARLLPDAVIIGFDIAIAEEGPVIIEANGDPHLIMLQIAHRSGVLDKQMLAALDFVRKNKKKKRAEAVAILNAERLESKKAMKQALSRESV